MQGASHEKSTSHVLWKGELQNEVNQNGVVRPKRQRRLSLSRRPWNLMLVKNVEVARLLNLLDLKLMVKAQKEKHRMVPEGH